MDTDSGSHKGHEGSGRFSCSVDDCGRSFLRKEHLTRHQRTHNPGSSHICRVCSKEFNRSDSLLRHLTRHGEVLKNPSGRSKKACIACHTAKIKCDGNKQCLACFKKGLRCRYRLQDEDDDPAPADSKDTSPSVHGGFSGAKPSSNGGNNLIPTPTDLDQVNIPSSLRLSDAIQNRESSRDLVSPGAQARSLNLSLGILTPRSDGIIDWSSVKIQSDSSRRQENRSIEFLHNTPAAEKYMGCYFEHFHHRWPMLHRPSYNDSNKGPVLDILISSMLMIGAWLEGSLESREYAITAHHEAMAQCFLGLSKISSHDIFQQSLKPGLGQASLMNIIFVLHCGTEQTISRGIILRNMLVAVIREVGFFKPDTIWADERPGYFLPMHQMKKGERERFAENLFKVDSYLNILRGQPPLLKTEELIFQLPSSFSLWNADGLYIVEERLRDRPLYRSEKSISQMISDNATEPFTTPEPSLLWEDLQLCFCAMQSSLWQLHSGKCNPHESETAITSQIKVLDRILQFLKQQYDHLSEQTADDANLQENPLISHYYGFEDHSDSSWVPIVKARVAGLEFDNLLLYHLLNLHLYADIFRLTQVAQEYSASQEEMSEAQRSVIGKRRCNTAGWVSSIGARRALCHATDILTAHQNLSKVPGLGKETLDPIAHIALATAALVVWVHCSFGLYTCDNCIPSMGLEADKVGPVIELVGCKTGQGAREAWIEMSDSCRIEIDGVQICPCSIEVLTAKFKACLPVGWGLVGTIAPGVFSSPQVRTGKWDPNVN